MDDITGLARRSGKCPDRFYNQLNGKSAVENYIDNKNAEPEHITREKIDEAVGLALDEMIKKIMR